MVGRKCSIRIGYVRTDQQYSSNDLAGGFFIFHCSNFSHFLFSKYNSSCSGLISPTFTPLMSRKYKKLREQILTLNDLHRIWSYSDIADELQARDCPPNQGRSALIRYIKYTIRRRGTVDARKRSGRPRTTGTPDFVSLVQTNVENQRRKSIRKTNKLLNQQKIKSSYDSV